MPLLIIGAEDARRLLPPGAGIQAMDLAMRAVSAGSVEMPPRLVTALADQRGHLFVMPASSPDIPVYGAKAVSLQPANPAMGRPAVQGFVVLFDCQTGSPVALVDGASVTALRTAAASALATRELARRGASSHGILGAGALAEEHLRAMACARNVTETRIWARNRQKAHAFAARMADETGMPVTAVERREQAAGCDIVTVATNASRPVLLGAWLNEGAHVNLVGAHRPTHRESDSEAASRARIYVDSMKSAMQEAGDILIPLAEGAIKECAIAGEIGSVLNGGIPGRQADSQITLYKSLGLAAQDLFAAGHIYQKALETGAGTMVDFP